MMEVSMLGMGKVLAMSALLGIAFGVCYDALRILRLAIGLRGKRAIAVVRSVEDFIFLVFAGICFSVFVYYTNDGVVRMFMFAGLAVGFALYSVSLGRAVIAAADKIICFVRHVSATLIRFAMIPIRHILRFISRKIIVPLYRLVCIPVHYMVCKQYTRRRRSSYFVKLNFNMDKI